MAKQEHWHTELHEEAGSAFSLAIDAKLAEVHTACQTIEVFRTKGFGNLMVIDDQIVLTSRDNFLYHEMMAHPVLFTHAHPRRVAIIGGGDCGTLRQVLRHRTVQQVFQVEIDEQVTRLAETFFPELCDSNADPRATLLFQDGAQWMARQPPGSLDVIIVDSTDPVGPAEGLYTTAFLRECARALDRGGLLVQQSGSPLYHVDLLRGLYAAMAQAGFSDRQTLFFPQCAYPSGWWSATMARRDGTFQGFREQDADTRSFPTRYYNAAIHRGALAVPEFFRVEMGLM